MAREAVNLSESSFSSALLKITRETDGIAFVQSTLSKDMETKVLKHLNFSNPAEKFMLIDTINSNALYVLYSGNPELAYAGIVITPRNEQSEAFPLHLDVTRAINSFYEHFSGDLGLLSPDLTPLVELKELQGLLFAVYANKPVILLHNNESWIRSVCLALLLILPPEIAKKKTILTHNENFTNNFSIIGLPVTDLTMEQLSDLGETHTIVSGADSRVFSPYESDFMKELAEAIKKKDTSAIEELISKLYNLADQVDVQGTIADLSANTGLKRADAELLHLIASDLEKPVSFPKNRVAYTKK
ncbi:MAG: hypothetical protein ACFFD4_14005 [Candidatus Odinarchaeota archaeon]